ncbi:MAG: HAD-IA family hydrolase [Bacilli bacterium]|nr:HAD-IA family hydrolase [Bacilli bacterium]
MKTQTNNKLVIFDWGGVIESHKAGEYNIDTALISLFKRFNNALNEEEIMNIYEQCYKNNNGLYMSEVNGIEEVEKWYLRLKQKIKLNYTFEEFCTVYKEETSKIYSYQDVVEFAHSLKKYCNIAILSNLNFLDKDRIDEQVELNKFDRVFLSFELECRKPDSRIYEIVEETCNIDPKNILFIDDKDTNIEAAKKRGWNTCMACGYELNKIKEEVNKFLNN